MRSTHLSPLYHPYAKTSQRSYTGGMELRYGLIAQTEGTFTEQPQGRIIAEGCGGIAEFLAQAPWDEKWEGLSATQPELDQYLYSHNSTCHSLAKMLEELPKEAIPTDVRKTLQQIHRTLQNSMMPSWPTEGLQPEISTPGFDVVISEIAEFETLRLGFLNAIKEILLGVYDKLTNAQMNERLIQPPQFAHLLDMQPALTWIQFTLPRN